MADILSICSYIGCAIFLIWLTIALFKGWKKLTPSAGLVLSAVLFVCAISVTGGLEPNEHIATNGFNQTSTIVPPTQPPTTEPITQQPASEAPAQPQPDDLDDRFGISELPDDGISDLAKWLSQPQQSVMLDLFAAKKDKRDAIKEELFISIDDVERYHAMIGTNTPINQTLYFESMNLFAENGLSYLLLSEATSLLSISTLFEDGDETGERLTNTVIDVYSRKLEEFRLLVARVLEITRDKSNSNGELVIFDDKDNLHALFEEMKGIIDSIDPGISQP